MLYQRTFTLAKCEQDGIVFKENGQPIDVLVLLREHHYNWIRQRLFVDPAASADKLPNDLPYTLAVSAPSAPRRSASSFCSTCTTPIAGLTPASSPRLPHCMEQARACWHKQLVEQVFNYARDTIAAFAAQGVMPDMVQVGNEVTNGMLWPDGKLPDNWDNFTDLTSRLGSLA